VSLLSREKCRRPHYKKQHVLTSFLSYNPAKNPNLFLQLMVRHIHQSYPHVVNMCQILKPAAENLVYHHRLSDDDDLEDVALAVERYLNKDWKRDPGKHVR
jgi:hypothetical protein